MTPEQIQALAVAIAAALAPLMAEHLAAAEKAGRVEEQKQWISDEQAEAMAAKIAEVQATKLATAMQGDADAALREQLGVLQTRCDAAEARVGELTQAADIAKLNADAAPWAAAIKRDGLAVEGFDPANPTREGVQAVERVYAQRALRGDAAGARSPLDIPAAPPEFGTGSQSTTSTRYARLS